MKSMIPRKSKQNPKLKMSSLSDGRGSLYLEYYVSRSQTPLVDSNNEPERYCSGLMAGRIKYKVRHVRKMERLCLYVELYPKTAEERKRNHDVMALAERIRYEREQIFLADRTGYRLPCDRKCCFLEYYRKFFAPGCNLSQSMRKSVGHSYRWLKRFIDASSHYSRYAEHFFMNLVTHKFVVDFVRFLQENGNGEGPVSVFRRFKAVVSSAMKDGYFSRNPCEGVRIYCGSSKSPKDILSPEEIRKLISTHYQGENREVQKAFVFSLFTGIRWCDIKELKQGDIDRGNGLLRFNQKKVMGRSSRCSVVIPLVNDLMQWIGVSDGKRGSDAPLFDIGSYVSCNHSLKRWVKEAGITKKISWHCARHSFTVNLINNGVNIKTVAELMGHSSIRMTERYLQVADIQKRLAIDSLDYIDLQDMGE